jgi:hypothetical protein
MVNKMDISQQLYDKYSRMFYNPIYLECDGGWNGLIEDFVEELYTASLPYRKDCVKISGIKEKFGAMRIYVDYHLPSEEILEFEKIVTKFEYLSRITCTICSDEGHIHRRRGYWDPIVCEGCYNKHYGDNNGI